MTFIYTQEVKSLLEELSFQKGELNVHISEKKTQLALIKQEMGKEEENLQVVLQQLLKHKAGKFKEQMGLGASVPHHHTDVTDKQRGASYKRSMMVPAIPFVKVYLKGSSHISS